MIVNRHWNRKQNSKTIITIGGMHKTTQTIKLMAINIENPNNRLIYYKRGNITIHKFKNHPE